VSGYRSLSEQAALYAKGRTAAEISARISKHGAGGAVTDAPPGSSAHNYGLAIDIEGRDQATIIALGKWIGFGTVSWDPAHLEWPNWQHLLG
jgi:LAS superfamily LD-carboxypeptidase LdcB